MLWTTTTRKRGQSPSGGHEQGVVSQWGPYAGVSTHMRGGAMDRGSVLVCMCGGAHGQGDSIHVGATPHIGMSLKVWHHLPFTNAVLFGEG